MGRYFIKFSYIGTQYRGAERNVISNLVRDSDSIQGALEIAFMQLLPRPANTPRVFLSSRTDAGVHALCSSAHVDIEPRVQGFAYDKEATMQSINRHLIKCRHQIRLLDFVSVKEAFNARHLAKSRTYLYRFIIPKRPDVFRVPIVEVQHSYHFRPETFDIERAQRATALFMGLKDFRSFSPKPRESNPPNYIRQLDVFKIQKSSCLMPYDPFAENHHYWEIVCKASGFVYNQVRRMTTALLALGAGSIDEKDIQVMLQVPNHVNWRCPLQVVPPHGLHLVNVEYKTDEVEKYYLNNPTDE